MQCYFQLLIFLKIIEIQFRKENDRSRYKKLRKIFKNVLVKKILKKLSLKNNS